MVPLNPKVKDVRISDLATNLNHAAPACGHHVLLCSNHTLRYLSKVGRPGAHHLVRVLYSYHEVSGLSAFLRPGGTLPSIPFSHLWSEPGYPPSRLPVPTFSSKQHSGHPECGTSSGTGVVHPQVRRQRWVPLCRAVRYCSPQMSAQLGPVSLSAQGNSPAPEQPLICCFNKSSNSIPFSKGLSAEPVPQTLLNATCQGQQQGPIHNSRGTSTVFWVRKP